MFPILFHIGPFTLHTYGLFVALGFILAMNRMKREFDREGIPIPLVDKLALILILTGLLGARVLYFGLNLFRDLINDPLLFFRIWEGGLVFYGGFLAALVVANLFSKKHEIPALTLTDALAAPLLLGQALGRLGCFSAGCCYGKETTSILGVVFTHPETLALKYAKLHPTQLYSSLGDFVLFGLTLLLARRSPKRGVLTSFYLVGYGVFRFLIEFLRGDDRGGFVGGLSPSQGIALLAVVAGLILIGYVKRNQKA